MFADDKTAINIPSDEQAMRLTDQTMSAVMKGANAVTVGVDGSSAVSIATETLRHFLLPFAAVES